MANDRIYFGAGIDWPLEQTAERAQLLESLGFDFLSTGEHVMQGSPPRPSTMVVPVLAAAAGATRRIRLLASVVLLPLYHPVLLAKLLAILDNVSAGRLIVGVGVGGEYPEEFEALGVPVEERGARADESLELLRRLWTGEPVTYEGRFWNVRGVALVPPPVQKPLPPIWVAGRRPAAMRRAARFGDGWYPHLYSPQRLQKSIEKIRELAQQEGRDLDGFQWAVQLNLLLDDSVEKAREAAIKDFSSRFSSGIDWRPIVDRYCLLGTPDDCTLQLQSYIDVGARYVTFQPVGDSARASSQLETFAREVVPRFRAQS